MSNLIGVAALTGTITPIRTMSGGLSVPQYRDVFVAHESGSIVSFSDAVPDAPYERVIASIEPVQSGSGDPSSSNVRPISGWTSLTITNDSEVSGKIFGLNVNYESGTYTRLEDAENLSAGADFDTLYCFGGRKLCNVADDGKIVAWYGDADYAEDGSNGQVMVYQPKFYYKVVPIKTEAIDGGIGYHLRNANYYISDSPHPGFKLHPAFYDANGEEIDYFLTGAYEGCLYDTSESAYITDDAQVMAVAQDKFSSIAGVKPASGLTQQLTRPNVETMAQNRGSGFHGDLIKLVSAEQLLMMIELGTMNFQTAISSGVSGISDSPNTTNNSSLTGSTASIGNGTGRAASTINEKNGTTTTETAENKIAMRWRGKENFYSNIWKFVYGVNIWGNGSMNGGQPYICNDFSFAESRNNQNYEDAGFTVANAARYISAMGYSTKCDWLFMPSETLGNSSLPVGDYTWVAANLNGYRIAQLGGSWAGGVADGGFCWALTYSVGSRYRNVGGRLVYVPTRNAADYHPVGEKAVVSVSFPSRVGTVYGGSLNVTTGVLTVEWGNIASYNGEPLSGEWISDRDVYSAGSIPTAGAQVVYKLATPVTYQLTPQEVTALSGANNVFADTGDIDVIYRVDV